MLFCVSSPLLLFLLSSLLFLFIALSLILSLLLFFSPLSRKNFTEKKEDKMRIKRKEKERRCEDFKSREFYVIRFDKLGFHLIQHTNARVFFLSFFLSLLFFFFFFVEGQRRRFCIRNQSLHSLTNHIEHTHRKRLILTHALILEAVYHLI